MKSVLIINILLGLIVSISCNRQEVKPKGTPGDIPGMGNVDGQLQTEEYGFHEDLWVSDMTGVDNEVVVNSIKVGSGDQVVVMFEVVNTNASECRSLWLRPGSLFEVTLAGYQNGILLSPVQVNIAPNANKIIELHLYCLNQGKSPSDEDALYNFVGVSSSVPMLELINLLEFKMANYEHYLNKSSRPSSYSDVKLKLQSIVWEITNGNGITKDSRSFISNLCQLPEGTFPLEIYDLYEPLPNCWSDMIYP